MQMLSSLALPHLAMETAEFAADPFPHFSLARAEHPWLARSVFGYVVTEYAAMKDLLAMDRLRTANDGVVAIMGAGDSFTGRFFESNIIAQQGESHRRLREVLAPMFTPRRANEVRHLMREEIDRLLDAWVPLGRFDFQDFASYFPISVLSRMIGGPVDAIPGLRSSLESSSLLFSLDRSNLPEIEAALLQLDTFARDLLSDRRSRPQRKGSEDLLDMLIAAVSNGQLGDREIVDLLIFLYSAGYDTSKNVLTLAMHQMIKRPDLYERCAIDAEFCRKVIEEMLRFCGVSTTTRLAVEDVEYRDVLLPAGTMLFFPVSVAGRDHGSFPGADTFDPERPIDPEYRHIAFGRGAHVCLGQHLARVQLQEGLHRIARRIREPKLAGEISWRPFPGIWGLRELPISFTPG